MVQSALLAFVLLVAPMRAAVDWRVMVRDMSSSGPAEVHEPRSFPFVVPGTTGWRCSLHRDDSVSREGNRSLGELTCVRFDGSSSVSVSAVCVEYRGRDMASVTVASKVGAYRLTISCND